MKYEVVIPSVGESISEVTIAQIFFKVDDFVNKDDELLELETEKVNVSVAAPISGLINSINVKVGDTIAIGTLVITMNDSSVKPSEASTEAQKVPEVKIPQETQKSEISSAAYQAKASPAASRIATENEVDLKSIAGTGRDGMVIKPDVINKPVAFSAPVVKDLHTSNTIACNAFIEETSFVKMSGLRKTVAKRLKEAQNTAALLTTFNEVDMSNVMAMRKANQDDFQKKHGVKLGFMSIFIKAATLALKEIPVVNAQIEGDMIKYNNHCHISVAIGTEKGLVVPVIKHCDQLSFDAIEKEIINYAKKAVNGKLVPNDFAGGTFTISNGGTYGSMMSTPIINPPQSAILGMHSIIERPIAVNGHVVIRPMMYLALSYDHRLIDGKDAVTFLVKIKNYVENPERMLLAC